MTVLATEPLSIADAAAKTGISTHTLRFYEREGLLTAPVARNGSGWRRYSPKDLEWIVVCTKLRATGMPLRAIRRYAELVRSGPGNEVERLALLEEHQSVLRARLAELRENMELIDYKVDVYKKRLADGDADELWSAQR
ncbi:MAG TPA: MerR family transcriptional regulator [Pseudonocardiaceae bacterium]|jgi:DNA-binding transcriptional MerR regulator|nr:MerR family transcriptional regulator [Pseudonocardiaceae bacterium]